MTGKSFKGNLEVLNLSDIFQSLAMNRHSGTLIVTDGKREKKIFFAEGEITLLSSSRRQRLGELLVSEDKITDEDLELALKLQKQSRKRLGEILVEEGFCEEEDIDRLVRHQIQEEIYDLFLWRKAEFEFIADQMPEDMARESPQLTRLAFNTNSLIMEALRRLDEWSLIRDIVPSTKEVFILTNEVDLERVDVPNRIRADGPKFVDGKTTVEGLAEKFYISEFELCKHLAEMVQAGAARALTQEELADRAEERYAVQDYQGAAALYGRLAEYYPDQPKILTPLADSLRRSGIEMQALSVYDQLASILQSSGRDPERLRVCLEAIVQLDPSRAPDVQPHLEDLHLRAVEAPGGRKLGPIIGAAVALIVVAVGLLASGVIGPSKDDDNTRALEAKELLSDYNKAIERNDYKKWLQLGWQLWDEYSEFDEAKKVELPILVATRPSGYSVYVNDASQRQTREDEPYLLCTFRPSDKIKVEIRAPLQEGEESSRVVVGPVYYDDPRAWHDVLTFQVLTEVDASFGDDMSLDAGVAYSQALDAYLVPSRSGELRVFQLETDGSRIRLSHPEGWDKLPLGPSQMGDLFTEPQTVRVGGVERLLVGAIEGGVLSLDLPEDGTPGEVQSDLYRANGQVVATPLVVSDEADGLVVFGTLHGEVLAYPLRGAKKATWGRAAGAAIRQPGVLVPGLQGCVFVGEDASVRGYALASGRELWSPWSSGTRFSGGVHALDASHVALHYETQLVVFDARAGQPTAVTWSPPEGETIVRVCSDPAARRVAVVTSGDSLFLLDERLSPAWKQPVTLPVSAVELAFHTDRLVVGWGYPQDAEADGPAAGVYELGGGRLVWQGGFEGGAGAIDSPISVFEEEGSWGFFFGMGTTLVRFTVVEY
jgi:tetratricopeptide (TPR) repeat protein